MSGQRGPWAAMPAQKQLDRDGNPASRRYGKPIFNEIIEFRGRATADKFKALVLGLIRAEHRAALSHPDGRGV